MNPAAHENEDNASAPVLYIALELSNNSRRLTFGGSGKRRQVSVPVADLMKLCAPCRTHDVRVDLPFDRHILTEA